MSMLDLVGIRPEFYANPNDRDFELQSLKYQQDLNKFNSRVQLALNEINERGATERELLKARHDAMMEAARKFGG